MYTKKYFYTTIYFLALILLPSCGKEDKEPEAEKEPTPIVTSDCQLETPKSGRMKLSPVDEYFLCLNSWAEVSPAKPDDKGSKIGEPTKPVQDGSFICTTQDYSLTKTPDSVVLLGDSAGDLWLGALLQSQPYLDGKFEQLPANLAPIDITINLSIPEPSVRVDNPSNSTIQKAISTLVSRAEAIALPAKASYNFKEAYSTEQLLLDFNLSAKYAGQTAKAALNINNSAEKKTISAYFVQNMFTVTVPTPVTPNAYFSDINLEYLKDQQQLGKISKENPPLYVSSITYGRLLLFTFVSNASSSDIQAALDYSYKGGAEVDAKAKAKYNKILSTAEINIVPYGGAWQDAAELIRTASIKSYFSNEATPLTTAVPISYQLKTLARNKQAAVAETTKYSERTCKKAKEPAIKKNAQFTLQYAADKRKLSVAKWETVVAEARKRPYPTLQHKAVKLQFRGSGDPLISKSNIRFVTLEKKSEGRALGKLNELGAWTGKKYVSYLESQNNIKQNWIFTKTCGKKKCADNYIRYGDSIHIRSEFKPKKYLCNDPKTQFLLTKEEKCTWRINR